MKKLLVACLMVILGVGCVGTIPHHREASPVIRLIGDSTVALVDPLVDTEGETPKIIYHVKCTGVWVRSDLMVTAAHCVAHDEDSLESLLSPVGDKAHYIVQDEVDQMFTEPTAMHLGKVVFYDKMHDVAFIHAEGVAIPRHSVTLFPKSLPALGEEILVVGHVKGMYWSYVRGVLAAYRDMIPTIGRAGPFVEIAGPVYKGNSGGGAFDSEGNLIGIASFLTPAPTISMFVSSTTIRILLSNYELTSKTK
jgi:hypothetical protein